MFIMVEDTKHNQGYQIFKTQCRCKGKICKVVVSSGSFTNLVSFEMVNKLNLPRIAHVRPYKAQGLDVGYCVDVKE